MFLPPHLVESTGQVDSRRRPTDCNDRTEPTDLGPTEPSTAGRPSRMSECWRQMLPPGGNAEGDGRIVAGSDTASGRNRGRLEDKGNKMINTVILMVSVVPQILSTGFFGNILYLNQVDLLRSLSLSFT